MVGRRRAARLQAAMRATDADVLAFARRTSRRLLQAQYGAPGPFNQTAPVADPQHQTAASLLSLHGTARIVVGVITDSTALANVYRVQFEKAKQPVVAVRGMNSTNSVMGPKDVGTFQPGTMVVCMWSESLPYAVILAAIPLPGRSAKNNGSTPLFMSTRARVDEAHKAPLRTKKNGHIPDFLSGGLFDGTTVGEQGWISETGLRIFVDTFVATLGLDEMTGVTAFYHDQLLRVSGYNLQIRSSARETNSFTDQFETLDETGWFLYPWEALGRFESGNSSKLKSPKEWQIDEPHYGKLEHEDDWAMPWHREREWHGYLGQGGKRLVQGPPQDQGTHASYEGGSGLVEAKHPGLFDFYVNADGRVGMQSAKGISISKRCGIVSPVRKRPADDPSGGAGDDETSYKFSSSQGSGPDHQITGDIRSVGGQDPGMNRALGVLDMHAYFHNYAGLHPFFCHSNDFKVYEESELDFWGGQSEAVPMFATLASTMYLSPESFKKTIQIDHRYGEQDFYTLSCGIEFLDDGGVVIYGGCGEEIRMVGGSIFASAPGDVWNKAGRNVNNWAGWDLINRAKNSADVTCTDGDFRVAAKGNVHVLSRDKGVMLEGRGQDDYYFDELGQKVRTGGVNLKAPRGSVVAWGNQVYARSLQGDIVLDANKGQGQVVVKATSMAAYVPQGVTFHFSTDGSRKSAQIAEEGTVLPGGLRTGGDVVAIGNGFFDGAVASREPHTSISGVAFVGKLEGDGLQKFQDVLSQTKQLYTQTLPQFGKTLHQVSFDQGVYAQNRPGNDDVIRKAEISLRTMEDYRTQDFRLYEDRWQQLARETGNATMTWRESPVTTQGQNTYPYPGRENFEGDKFYQQGLSLFDAQAGRSKDRGSDGQLSGEYTDPRFKSPEPATIDRYLVIR